MFWGLFFFWASGLLKKRLFLLVGRKMDIFQIHCAAKARICCITSTDMSDDLIY